MNPQQLLLRCYAEREPDGKWFAICLDLNLATEAGTQHEATEKLHAQIVSYVREALTVDAKYASHLLPRRAPMSFFIRYYWMQLLSLVGALTPGKGKGRPFTEPLPLVPA
jgi:hypothetical protein